MINHWHDFGKRTPASKSQYVLLLSSSMLHNESDLGIHTGMLAPYLLLDSCATTQRQSVILAVGVGDTCHYLAYQGSECWLSNGR